MKRIITFFAAFCFVFMMVLSATGHTAVADNQVFWENSDDVTAIQMNGMIESTQQWNENFGEEYAFMNEYGAMDNTLTDALNSSVTASNILGEENIEGIYANTRDTANLMAAVKKKEMTGITLCNLDSDNMMIADDPAAHWAALMTNSRWNNNMMSRRGETTLIGEANIATMRAHSYL